MPNESQRAAYRILDASANRAGEGLRTLEEYTRFVLNDTEATGELKSIRHDLAEALSIFDRESMLAARDTPADVGTTIGVATEYRRTQDASVVAAAASRTQQSLRVIEEYGKTINPDVSRRVEQIRYRCYTICGQLELQAMGHRRQSQLAKAQLYVLIASGDSEEAFAATVKSLFEYGVDVLQLRDGSCDDRMLYQRALIGSRIATELNGLFIVNDRADLAVAAEADGVHIGQDELPAPQARAILGDRRLVGVSTHTVDQVHTAVTDGADYIGCGPVFAGTTKCFDRYVGPQFLSDVHQATKRTPLPAFAIGGITIKNVDQVTAAGFHRIAVTGAVRDAADTKSAIKELKQKLVVS